jgi:hypothetical protein
MDNLNRSVTLNLNLAGLKALSGNKKSLDKGYYNPSCTDFGTVGVNTRDGKALTKAVFTLDFGGITRTADVFLPENDQDKIALARWRGVAESFGYTAAILDNGSVTFNRDSFVGGTAHVYNDKRAATDGSGKEYDNVSFLTPADWASGKRAEESVAGGAALGAVSVTTPVASAPVTVATPSVTPAAPVAAPAANAANLRAALGLR